MSVELVYEVRCDFTQDGEGCEEVCEATGESRHAVRWYAANLGWLVDHQREDYCPTHRGIKDGGS